MHSSNILHEKYTQNVLMIHTQCAIKLSVKHHTDIYIFTYAIILPEFFEIAYVQRFCVFVGLKNDVGK